MIMLFCLMTSLCHYLITLMTTPCFLLMDLAFCEVIYQVITQRFKIAFGLHFLLFMQACKFMLCMIFAHQGAIA